MIMNNKLVRARELFNTTMMRKQDTLATFEGDMGDGTGVVQVPGTGKENFSYVRINDTVHEVFNTKVPLQEGLRVVVGYEASQPTLMQVLGTRTASPFGTTGRKVTPFASSSYYRWGGADPLWIDKRVWLPRRISCMDPSEVAYDEFTVRMYQDTFYDGTDFIELASTLLDIGAYIPTTAGKALFVLITLNTSGTLTTTVGVEVDIASLAIGDVPVPPLDTSDILAAVVLYYGQTAIQETSAASDIWDLRFTFFSGSGGGGGYPLSKQSVDAGALLTIPPGFAYIVGPDFTVDGDLHNDGDMILVG